MTDLTQAKPLIGGAFEAVIADHGHDAQAVVVAVEDWRWERSAARDS